MPAAALGWLVTGALVPSTITACGWAVIESGRVSDQVWTNHRIVLVMTSSIAVLWVIAYTRSVPVGKSRPFLDVAMCLGVGATAWALPWIGLGYTVGDHWEGSPLARAAPIGEKVCGMEPSLIGAVLVGGGHLALICWIIGALMVRLRRASISVVRGMPPASVRS